MFSNPNIDIVKGKLSYPSNCEILKGIVPDILTKIQDTFCFVNLDMDLYSPTLDALKFFYPKMENGGVILVHDYFHERLPNVEAAVHDFEISWSDEVRKISIGDNCSIAIIR